MLPTRHLFRTALGLGTSLVLVAGAHAQSFNVDISDLLGVPSSSFGGAANQPGVWNLVGGSSASNLVTPDGTTTDAWFNMCCFSGVLSGSLDPDIGGDLGALMQDAKYAGFDNDGPLAISFRVVIPGVYEVYTYAWHQNVTAPGATEVSAYHSIVQSQTTGGAWPGALVEGVTHTRHRMTSVSVPVVFEPVLYLELDEADGPRYLAGLQVVYLGPPGDSYCTSTPNSTGQPASITTFGSISVLYPSLELHAGPVPDQFGVFFYGPEQAQVPFADGFRCVAPGSVGLARLPVTQASGGVLSALLNVDSPPFPAAQITALSTWNFQAWFRDPAAGGTGANLSDGRVVTFLP